MRKRTAGLLLCLYALFEAPSAHADFVVAGSSSGTKLEPGAGANLPAPRPVDEQPQSSPPASTRSASPRFSFAQGFGDRVPLGFAVRQIVPGVVKVKYGPGADPDALVDWKGGQGWNWVLFNAVRPIGLRLVLTHRAVEIRK